MAFSATWLIGSNMPIQQRGILGMGRDRFLPRQDETRHGVKTRNTFKKKQDIDKVYVKTRFEKFIAQKFPIQENFEIDILLSRQDKNSRYLKILRQDKTSS